MVVFLGMNAPAKDIDAPSPAEQRLALAAFYKAAGDALRLSILRLLQKNDYGVKELCKLLDVKQPSMSHHLKVLANAGLVVTRRDGNSIYYRRAPVNETRVERETLRSSLFSALDGLPIEPEILQRTDIVHDERSRASREFFQQNADRFQSNQDLIASYVEYGESITNFLDAADTHKWAALEVGSGEGDFLAELSPRYKQVTALDNSLEMLKRAQKFAENCQLENIRFIHGDTRADELKGQRFDCITVNMVLHHTPHPAQIFSDLGQLLTPGGSMLVTDLCQHDQDWARESCGDLWLGFDPQDLSRWAADAGLREGQSLYLTQRNGFQLQLRQFTKPIKK